MSSASKLNFFNMQYTITPFDPLQRRDHGPGFTVSFMSTTKQMLTMRMLTNPFPVIAYDSQPVAPGAERKSLGTFNVAFETQSLPGNVVEFTFDYLNQQHPSPEMIHGVIAAVQASIAAADQKLSEFARILLILNPWDIDQFATAESVRQLESALHAVARKARVQDQLNQHGFDAIWKANTALQPQPRKTPRNRNRNK